MNDIVTATTDGVIEQRLADMRQRVYQLEEALLRGPTFECPVKHYFSRGLYAREMFIPKGTVVTGKIHKHENLNIMSKGELSVLTENGVVRVKAPFTVISPPGIKRAAYAHEDTVWTTIHPTDERDLAKIEAEFIAQNEMEYIEFCKMLSLGEELCLGVQ